MDRASRSSPRALESTVPADQHVPGGDGAVEGQLHGSALGKTTVEGEREGDGLVFGHPGGLAHQAGAGHFRLGFLGGDGLGPPGGDREEAGGEEQAEAGGASDQGNGAPSTSRPGGSGRKPIAS